MANAFSPSAGIAEGSGAEIGSIRKRRGSLFLLLTPAGLLLGVLLLCSLLPLRMSFGEKNGELTRWTLANYAILFDPTYLAIFGRTIGLALASAIVTTIIAFPVALFMARTPSTLTRRLVLICVMLPMLVSLLVQSYGWIIILGPDGILNTVLAPIFGDRSTALLFNGFGVLLGLVQTSLPLAVLPIASALETIPPALEEAADVLGAPRRVVYCEIILPLAHPGILTAAFLTFAFNAGAFAVPMLLGGLKVTTAALVIRDQMGTLLDWPLGSALSVVLTVLVLGVLLFRRIFSSTPEKTL